VATLVALVGGVIFFMGSQIAQQTTEFVEQFQQASGSFEERLQKQPWWKYISGLGVKAEDALTSQRAVWTATTAVTSLIAALMGGVMVIFLGFYFALEPAWYRGGLLKLVPSAHRQRTGQVLDMMGQTLWYWFLGRLVGMAVIGVGSAVGLWLLGVPLAVSLGVFAGLMNFIPNFGPLIAMVPAILFALQQGTQTALYVFLFYLVLQFFESYFLTPLIEEKQVALPPGLTLSNQLLFGLAAGFMGLLLATPLAVVITILVREFYVKDLLQTEPAIGKK
jgi:predicted PurR-regulated permease PerM